jgi:hypothetical protein
MSLFLQQWIYLYEKYAGKKYSAAENDRRFTAFTGVTPIVAETIYCKYATIGRSSPLYSRFNLLLVLHFLKVAPTEDRGAQTFKIGSRNTYRKKLWVALNYLNDVMTEISIDDRYFPFVPNGGAFKNVCMVVDGTECPIDRYVR